MKSNDNEVVEDANGKRAASMVVAGNMALCVFIWENRLFIVRRIDLNRWNSEVDAKKSYKLKFRMGGFIRFGEASVNQD